MKVLVAGAGAVGSWLGAGLAAGGAEVTLVARGAHGMALARDGLRLVDARGEAHPAPAPVMAVRERIVDAAADGPFDVVLVTVRSCDTAAVAAELAAHVSAASVASFQNGVGNEAVLAAARAGRPVPAVAERPLADASGVVACTLTRAVWLTAPGCVTAGTRGGCGVAASRRAERAPAVALADALRAGGVPVRRYADASAMKWSKLALNLLGAATSALLGRPPSALLRERRWFAVERAVFREALAVMRALRLRSVMLPAYPVPAFARLARQLPEGALFRLLGERLATSRGDRMPGLAADVAAGRRTEIHALHGAVAAAAAALGGSAPVCARVTALVEDITEGRRARDAFAADPDALLAALGLGPRAG